MNIYYLFTSTFGVGVRRRLCWSENGRRYISSVRGSLSPFIFSPTPHPLSLSRPGWSLLSSLSSLSLYDCVVHIYLLHAPRIHPSSRPHLQVIMVVLNGRFALLAALSSIAAVSLCPATVEGAAIQVEHARSIGQPVVARHSSHKHSAEKDVSKKHSSSLLSEKQASSKKVAENDADNQPQRHAKPVLPLPARIAQKHKQKGSAKNTVGSGGHARTGSTESKHAESKRTTWNPTDPVSRIERYWIGGRELATRDGSTLPPRLDTRHHHHHHDHHDHEKVVVTGDHDHVNVHRRSVAQVNAARAPHDDDHDRILVEGHNDHVHVHDDHDEHGRVVVKGDDNHVHARRSPSPHHHHHYDHDKVIVKGDHDSVHFHRSPEPSPHHHHHHDKVVVKGDHDHVDVHRRSPAPRHHHHSDKVIVKGDNEHVHVGRSPAPEPRHHHHHHHHADNVVVKGDDDHVNVHERRRAPRTAQRQPIVISGNGGNAFLVHHSPPQIVPSLGGILDMNLHLRRDGQGLDGVPGSIEIMSQVANSTVGQRIASLVLAAPSNGTSAATNSTGSAFVLNASDTDRTQMYLVTAANADDGTSTSNNTSSNSTSPASSTPASFIRVALQMPVFDAASAQLMPYCATFDPRPAAPAAMTVEACMGSSSTDEHKSQVFAYEPGTGVIRPMWYEGEDDGTDDNSTGSADDPSDDEDSDDDEGGTDESPATNTTTVDPMTPTSDKVASVTSFEQEALDNQYGDATRPPARMASVKQFSAEVLSTAQNVTLVFSPAAPEVPPLAPPAKVAIPASDSASASATTTDATATATASSAISSDVPVSLTSSAAALEAVSTTSSADSTSDSASAPTSSASSTSCTGTDSTATTSATGLPALEVKVFNPYAESLSSSAASLSATTSMTSSSPTSTMTPVSTAPYEWMFKQGSLTDLN
ncbi:hypothetical protein OH77DRAFT_1250871 [Trametes cingulata]|nr:hypothetical protein OH77DRAFT_1250871 [Trametes cingulata]